MRVLAERFEVSRGLVEKISRQQRQSGGTESVEQRHGPLSKVTAEMEESLREQVRQRPDRTLGEWQQGADAVGSGGTHSPGWRRSGWSSWIRVPL